MLVYTDEPDYARSLFAEAGRPPLAPVRDLCADSLDLVSSFFPRPSVFRAASHRSDLWCHALVSGFADGSQYDRIIRLGRQGVAIPDGVACVARTGNGFQGFHGRSWSAHPGNIHLTVHLAPRRPVERFESVFMALAAVAVVETLDRLPGLAGRAGIRWVNDVVLDGAKVAGVLAHTQTRGAVVTSAVLGIGLNVEATPAVRPTAFVPSATSLADHGAGGATAGAVLRLLLASLERNYHRLLADGYRPIVERYRSRSVVLGQDVVISADHPDQLPRPTAAGRVTAIGDGLELSLAGRGAPVRRGRLIMGAAMAAHHQPCLRAS